MSYFDTYKKRVETKGASFVDTIKNTTDEFISMNFENNQSYRLAKYKKADIEESTKDIRVVNVDNDSGAKKIYILPNDILDVGDYLFFDKYWWIIDGFNNNLPSPCGTSLKCNQTISWKDENGKIYRYPCNIQNDSYGAKILLSNDAFGEVSQKCKVIIQNNKDTLKFLRPDFRFILSNSDTDIYKVGTRDIGIDSGIITLTCSKDVLKDEDDLENNIAYNGVTNNETDNNDSEQTETTYTITGNPKLIKGKQQTYELNEEVQGIEWRLDQMSIDAELAEIVSQDNKTCVLTTTCGDGEPVTLSCYLDNKEIASIDLICARK